MPDVVLEDLILEQHGVFTPQQATSAGLVRSDIGFLLRSGSWERVRRGVYAESERLDPEIPQPLREVAAVRLALHDNGVCSHETAALLHGLPVDVRADCRVILTMTPERRSHRDYDGVHVHRAGLPGGHVTTVSGFPTTSVARTLVDLARNRRFGAALIPTDYALHHHLLQREPLNSVMLDCRRWPGTKRAAEVLAFADPGSESPLESLGRLCLHRYGVPAPVLQHEIVLADGGRTRVDFWWEEGAVVGEADGLNKYADATVLRREKLRQEGLECLGFTVVRFTWADVTLRPAETAARFQAALARRQRRTAHLAP
ncbi:MAG: type IV toxin-antitoxin system AbiEi family antitoxin domain-containing protein [Geodermatophilaceae bacterium]